MNQLDDLRRVSRQRNGAMIAAVVLVLAGFGLCLPPNLARRRELESTNQAALTLQYRLLILQRQLTERQDSLRSVQDDIRRELR